MREPQDYGRLATGLADMARDLLAQDSVESTLSTIAAHAVKLLEGCDAAGILMIKRGEVVTLASTSAVAELSARLQAELGEGPWWEATAGPHQLYRIRDLMREHRRWPRYVERASELGVGSMMGFLLFTDGRENLGALDMYSSRHGAFDSASEHVGWVLASHAAVALSSARGVESMGKALASSRQIGAAVGVVMCRYGVTEDVAFDTIRRTSQERNVKVRDLATMITSLGGLPESE